MEDHGEELKAVLGMTTSPTAPDAAVVKLREAKRHATLRVIGRAVDVPPGSIRASSLHTQSIRN
jgi:hypothetical protein